MGVVASSVTAAALGVYGVVQAIRTAFEDGDIQENPIVHEITNRIHESTFHMEEEELGAEETVQWDEDTDQWEEDTDQWEEVTDQWEEDKRELEAAIEAAERERAEYSAEAERAHRERAQAEDARCRAERRAADDRTARDEAERKLREGIRPVFLPTMAQLEATKERLQYKAGLFHFAVAGIAGSGKSSLINAFRGLRNSSKGAAPRGVAETTAATTRYPDPDPKNPFVWYDVPGAGTLSIPDCKYFTDQGLYIFDCIVVLFDNRFTETDVAILRNCAACKIPTYIVRSKSRQHIRNVLDDKADVDMDDPDVRAAAREEYIAATRAMVARNLQEARPPLPEQKVYMVDKETLNQVVNGKEPKDYIDEWLLLQDLLGEARRRRVVDA